MPNPRHIAVEEGSVTTPYGPGPNTPPPQGIVEKGGTLTVYAGGFPVATSGTIITPHGVPKINPKCSASFILPPTERGGSFTVYVEGLPVATIGSLCDCGHAIMTGIPTVIVGP